MYVLCVLYYEVHLWENILTPVKFQWINGKKSRGTKIGKAVITCSRYGSVDVCVFIAARWQRKALLRTSNLCRQVRVEPQSGPCVSSLNPREWRHKRTASPSLFPPSTGWFSGAMLLFSLHCTSFEVFRRVKNWGYFFGLVLPLSDWIDRKPLNTSVSTSSVQAEIWAGH